MGGFLLSSCGMCGSLPKSQVAFNMIAGPELTGSQRAKAILDNWSEMLPRFIKIFPHEFKRVLGVSRTRQPYIPGQPLPFVAAAEQVQHG